MRTHQMNRTTGRRVGLHSLGTLVSGLLLALFCSSASAVAENPDPSLGGVSRSFIEANGIKADVTLTLRGTNQDLALQIPRSGFDIINDGTLGTALLRGVKLQGGSCDGLTDDAFFLIHVAGRPGDADGDGVFNSNAGPCEARRGNSLVPGTPKIIDGNSGDLGVLAFGENLRLRLDRNCDGNADLVFSLSNSDPREGAKLRVELDDFTGTAGTFPGGGTQGVAWEAAVFPGAPFNIPCADAGPIDGYYIIRIPAFSSYFASQGLNPGDFGFVITAGSDDDGLGEDLTAGRVNLSEPELGITKGPDLSLCPNAEGNYTIVVTNNGNATVTGIVVSDQLPAGATLVSVVSGGVTPSGNSGLVTFSPFDLAQCESRTIVIRVRANADCTGNDLNSASAAGSFSSFCTLTSPGQLDVRQVSAGPATAAFICLPGPCVTASCTPDRSSACPGETVNLTVRGTNCSAGPVTMKLEIGVGTAWYQSFDCPEPVAAGGFCEHTFAVVMPACDAGNAVTFPSQATATNECSSTTTITPNPCSVNCKGPDVEISKSAEAEVQPGGTIHYTITVTNESKDTDLTDVIVIDDLCSYVSNPTNFGGSCDVGAPQINGSQITWPAFSLARNSSCTLTFEVTAGNTGECTETVTCRNDVRVSAKCGDATDTASSFAETVIPCTPVGLCRLTGGGCLNDDPDTNNRGRKQHTFGGNSSPLDENGNSLLTGNEWQHVHRDGREILFNWHSHDAHVIACSVVPPGPCSPNHGDITRADFVGTGKFSRGSGSREEDGNMVAYIIDHREGSCNRNQRDEYSIVVRTGLVIGQGALVFDAEGEIDCGNLQIHQTPARIFGGVAQLPETQAGIESIALLNKVVPNPFQNSMSFAYEVPEGGSGVEIGVYNVAGRLVKSLASGPQSAGRQAITWDGRDGSGVQMARGVYFLKSTVAGKQTTHRVIYMNP